jgi:hypothetical protein
VTYGRERRGAYRFMMGKCKGRRPLGRPRHRLENNISVDLKELRCGVVDWIYLNQDGGN